MTLKDTEAMCLVSNSHPVGRRVLDTQDKGDSASWSVSLGSPWRQATTVITMKDDSRFTQHEPIDLVMGLGRAFIEYGSLS
jgi:hypothetical protein